MATKKQNVKPESIKLSKSKEIANWDEELAKYAQEASAMEANSGGGQFFGLQSGILSWDGGAMPGNQMLVIILDHIFETVFYDGPYNPDTPQSPVAFAFGRVQEELRWHENSHEDFAGKLCSESEVCEWGSADTGKGKAARETRRLAMIPAGVINRNGDIELNEDPEFYKSSQIGFMKLPVTSVKGFAGFVKQVSGTLKRPPFGVFTKVSVVPDAKTQFKVVFEAIDPVDNALMDAIMNRVKEVREVIDFPYQREEVSEVPVKSAKKKPVVKKKRY